MARVVNIDNDVFLVNMFIINTHSTDVRQICTGRTDMLIHILQLACVVNTFHWAGHNYFNRCVLPEFIKIGIVQQ